MVALWILDMSDSNSVRGSPEISLGLVRLQSQ